MLSDIEKPPSTDATPRMTPRDWSVERVRFSRISTQEFLTRSRKAPLNMTLLRRLLHFDQSVHDLDLALCHGGDREVVRDDDDGVALAVQVHEELQHFVAGLLVQS